MTMLYLLVTVAVLQMAVGEVHEYYLFQNPYEANYKTLVAVSWTQDQDRRAVDCETIHDQTLIELMLKGFDNPPIQKPIEMEFSTILDECAEVSQLRKRSGVEESRGLSLLDSVYNALVQPEGSKRHQQNHPSTTDTATQPTTAIPKDEDGKSLDYNHLIGDNDNDVSSETDFHRAPVAEDDPVEGYDGWPVIFPGTKWCGAGDVAKHYDDLGLHQDTDRCCRAHDLCNDTLAPKESRSGLTNKSPFTKLSCTCDMDFYHCLDRVNSVISNTIGNMYFNTLKRTCYEMDYPVTNQCKRWATFLKLKCLEYKKDQSAPMVMIWKPAKYYKKIPVPGPLTITLPF